MSKIVSVLSMAQRRRQFTTERLTSSTQRLRSSFTDSPGLSNTRQQVLVLLDGRDSIARQLRPEYGLV
jgi:hypothetical protein